MVDLVTDQLEISQQISEPAEEDGAIATRYFEDYLFNILTDLNSINDDAVFSLANLGAGAGVFAQEVANVAQLKSLVAGTNITITADADEITINSAGSGAQVGVGTVADSILTWNGVDTWTELTNLLISFGSPNLDIRSTFDGGELRLRADDAGSVTQNLFVGDPDGSSDVYHDGAIHIQTNTFGANIPTTGAFTGPVGTTAQEPAAVVGMMRYDSTTGKARIVDGGVWVDVVGGGSLPVPTVESSILTGDLGGGDFDELTEVTIAWVAGVMTISVENDAAALQSVIVADADAGIEFLFDTELALATEATGIAVYDGVTGQDDPNVILRSEAGAQLAGLGVLGSDTTLENNTDGGELRLRGDDAGSTLQNLVIGDPDADVALFHDGSEAFQTSLLGIRIADASAAGITALEFFDSGFVAQEGAVLTAFSSTGIKMRSNIHGATVSLDGEDAGGTAQDILLGDPDGELALYFNGTVEAVTKSGGFRVDDELEIDGDLNHDGTNIGFYGTVPAAQSAAYTRNATIVESRTLLASASATIVNNNNVLAALIADLQAIGILG